MPKFILALLLVALAVPALAQNVKFKAGTVSTGDSLEKLLKVAGKPDRIQPFPGMPAFQRYEYFSDGRNVTVTVKEGKITGIGVLDFTSK
ncbi:MAG: hypothetical protein EON92_19615 [Burkholderiales bacterium]|nr:MAG: hypothetical protein EON92_19615 [Burkholderiales bacterium]